jgi:hypothetical protein
MSVGWLLVQYELVLRNQWQEVRAMTMATELAVSRVLARTFSKGKDKTPPIPTFEQVFLNQAGGSKAPSDSRFTEMFAAANKIALMETVKTDDRP